MALSLTRRWRWVVPASVLGVIAVGAVALPVLADDPDLPERTAEQLLADLEAADPVPISAPLAHRRGLAGFPECGRSWPGPPVRSRSWAARPALDSGTAATTCSGSR